MKEGLPVDRDSRPEPKGVRALEFDYLASLSAKTFDEHSQRTLDHELEIAFFHIALKAFCNPYMRTSDHIIYELVLSLFSNRITWASQQELHLIFSSLSL